VDTARQRAIDEASRGSGEVVFTWSTRSSDAKWTRVTPGLVREAVAALNVEAAGDYY